MDPTFEQNSSADVDDTQAESDHHEALVEDELLIEEISIDGMCGVY